MTRRIFAAKEHIDHERKTKTGGFLTANKTNHANRGGFLTANKTNHANRGGFLATKRRRMHRRNSDFVSFAPFCGYLFLCSFSLHGCQDVALIYMGRVADA